MNKYIEIVIPFLICYLKAQGKNKQYLPIKERSTSNGNMIIDFTNIKEGPRTDSFEQFN